MLTISVISSFSRFHTRKLQLCSILAIKMNSQGACKLLLKHGFKPLLGRDLKIKLVITECLRGRVTSFILGGEGQHGQCPRLCPQAGRASPGGLIRMCPPPPPPATLHLTAWKLRAPGSTLTIYVPGWRPLTLPLYCSSLFIEVVPGFITITFFTASVISHAHLQGSC